MQTALLSLTTKINIFTFRVVRLFRTGMSDFTPGLVLKAIKEQEIKFLDFRFTDLYGKWHHITKSVADFQEEDLEDLVAFDGSSFKGWRGVENSDMFLVPDYSTFFVDPFATQNTAVVICDICDPLTKKPYTCDPRSIAKLAEKYFFDTKIGTAAYFGPEPEFFIFDEIRYKVSATDAMFSFTSSELDQQSDMKLENGNLGHRVGRKGGYAPVSPDDHLFDIRNEMVILMQDVGVEAYLHHHEVAASQCEIGFKFSTLTKTADNTQKYKYIVKNVSASFGKSATFMPKPLHNDSGSGMHVHQSIWKNGKNIFAGKDYSNLSETALFYVGGIMKHAKTIAAFANPTVNSYKRLLPGYEAPETISYSAANRSAAVRIPYSGGGEHTRRIEVRFPDPAANPYLLFSAMLLAGIDGIQNKIHPGEPKEQNLYKSHDASIQKLPSSLENSLKHLEKEHDFLLKGGVFTKEVIHSYIEIKRKEVEEFRKIITPLEFKMYYSL